ncbi:hypothetical protein [Allobranchiibius sp. GilTou73]|uniref:hypothetical protein n=1 Tax=Allobranchiibius sp. GilTou73 TaxID=2904523 RepID=UPI001F3BDF47|nr:hypothetical protein [Allobranchiibius sp. GilTou73]UIJ34819.1 hypothetical protein LVQ62_17295 [Allobranchiibius sp. GilTou73]
MGEEEATNVTAGIWGFLILFALAMACWFLYRSMNRHLRNVRMQHEADLKAEQDRAPAGGQASAEAGGKRPEDLPG